MRSQSRYAFALALLALAGCSRTAGAPAPTSLVGLTIDDVIRRLGQPDSTTLGVFHAAQQAFGPTAQLLSDGDAYQFLFYKDFAGRQFHVWAVDPAIWKRIQGSSPGPGTHYVIEVADFEAGVVF